MPELPWYAELREASRPDSVRVPLIGESAPDPGDGDRFFYCPKPSASDNLYRGVMLALYDYKPSVRVSRDKSQWLERLKDDGVFLIDLVPFPINPLSESEKRRAREEHVSGCVACAQRLEPAGVIVCHDQCFKVIRAPLRAAGLPLLHEETIPFRSAILVSVSLTRFRTHSRTSTGDRRPLR